MKKLLIGLTSLVLVLGLANLVYALDSTEIGVTVTLTGSIGFELGTTTAWDIGSLAVGGTATMADADKITITSTGTFMQTYNLLCYEGTWNPGTTQDTDVYVMSARILDDAATEPGTFVAGDIIPGGGTSEPCDETNFGGGGYNVLAGEINTLWLQFAAPTNTAVTTVQAITVKLGVQ